MEEVGKKEKRVREGVVKREMKEVEFMDSDVAPVIGFSVSIAPENYEGRGEG